MRPMMRGITMLAVALGLIVGLVADARAGEPVPITIGTTGSDLDVGFFIAFKRGYFLSEGVDAKFVSYDDSIKMMAPLATGQLAVANVSSSARVLSAIASEPTIKIVADGGSTPAEFSRNPLMVRRDIARGGHFKSLKDLKGMRVAVTGQGSAEALVLSAALAKAGLKLSDVSSVYLSAALQASALQNGTLDAAFPAEPWATVLERRGAAFRAMSDTQIYPNRQVGLVVFSGGLVDANPNLGQRVLKAYLRGVRDYADALKNGRFDGPKAGGVISILSEFTSVKDAGLLVGMAHPGFSTDGSVNVSGINADVRAYRAAGALEAGIAVDKIVDPAFAAAAVKQLGPYRRQ